MNHREFIIKYIIKHTRSAKLFLYKQFNDRDRLLLGLCDIYEPIAAVVELCLNNKVYLAGKIKSSQTS